MPRVRARAAAVLVTAAALLLPAGTAQAAWSARGTGAGAAKAVVLAAPVTVATACPTLAVPRITWTAVPNATKYDVFRKNGSAAATQIATGVTGTTFNDNTGGPTLQNATYSVRAGLATWTSPLTAAAPVFITAAGLCVL